MQIVFVLLAHDAASMVARVARVMTATGHRMVIHSGAKVADGEVRARETMVSDLCDRVRFAAEVGRCGGADTTSLRSTRNTLSGHQEKSHPTRPINLYGYELRVHDTLNLLPRHLCDGFCNVL